MCGRAPSLRPGDELAAGLGYGIAIQGGSSTFISEDVVGAEHSAGVHVNKQPRTCGLDKDCTAVCRGEFEVPEGKHTLASLVPCGQLYFVFPFGGLEEADFHAGQDPDNVVLYEVVIPETDAGGMVVGYLLSLVHERECLVVLPQVHVAGTDSVSYCMTFHSGLRLKKYLAKIVFLH